MIVEEKKKEKETKKEIQKKRKTEKKKKHISAGNKAKRDNCVCEHAWVCVYGRANEAGVWEKIKGKLEKKNGKKEPKPDEKK